MRAAPARRCLASAAAREQRGRRRASPSPHGAAAGRVGPLLLGAVLVAAAWAAAAAAPGVAAPAAAASCPGGAGGVCTRACQLQLCQALADFYHATTNTTNRWDNEAGWQLTETLPCEQLVGRSAAQPPVYCRGWFGVLCCTAADLTAGTCSLLGSVRGLELMMNNLNGSISDPALVSPLQQLHACGLTVLNLEANNLSGSMVAGWARLVHLRVLVLSNSYIEGTIPEALRSMRNLTRINMGNSFLYGTLPEWIGELERLEAINWGTLAGTNNDSSSGLRGSIPDSFGKLKYLRELNLESNFLSGTLPHALCSAGNSLVRLSVRANQLVGPARAVQGCALQQLDLSHNNFTGELPASKLWKDLSIYQCSHNKFSRHFPRALCLYTKALDTLDISHNQLEGVVPACITLMAGLKNVIISHNSFEGMLPDVLFFLPAIKRVDVSNNQLVGTIPESIEWPYALVDLDYSNNPGITGTIPDKTGILPNLKLIQLTGTSVSCAGVIRPFKVTTNASCSDPQRCTTPVWYGVGRDNASTVRCADDALLPCFLRFSDYAVPRDDASNMRCKFATRKQPDDATAACSATTALGDAASTLPDLSRDSLTQQWILSPAYFQYRTCSCLQGFVEAWSANGTQLTCVEVQDTDRRTIIIVGVLAGVAGLALLLALGVLAWLYLRTQPRWLRERIMQSKRMAGAPHCSKPGDKVQVSIVVTDVKDFSALTRAHHELMMKAMSVHNNILRKACHVHAGFVLDQEGDSWTIAFHDAQDAVAFSLQVQQALAKKSWGVRLTATSPAGGLDGYMPSFDTLRLNSSTATRSSVSTMHHLLGLGDSLVASPASAAGVSQAAAAAAAVTSRQNSHDSAKHSEADLLAARARPSNSFTSSVGRTSDTTGSMGVAAGGLEHAPSGPANEQGDGDGYAPSVTVPESTTSSGKRRGMAAALLAQASQAFSGRSAVSLTGHLGAGPPRGLFRSAGGSVEHPPPPPVSRFLRLSVRIGIASGTLPCGVDVASCAVRYRAQDVSDVANAGQVLVDEPTFLAIKDSLSVLGTVTASGFNDAMLSKLMHAQAVSKLQKQVACCGRWPGSSTSEMSFTGALEKQAPDYESDAVVLHMGCFDVPDAPVDDPAAVTNAPVDAGKGQHSARGAHVAAGGRQGRRMRIKKHRAPQQLNLYSISAPGMRRLPKGMQQAELMRKLGWAEPVNIRQRPSWAQITKSYFEAPSARQMDLSPQNDSNDRHMTPAPLREVTVVFAAVEGAESFATKHGTAALSHRIIACMQQMLNALPGKDGYLCRCQESDLRYMVAFEAPHKALQWCLLVQEALLYQDWPEAVLHHAGCETVVDPLTCRPLWRGPRLRMGLAEGQPHAVAPDHTGRATYFGPSVNLAARIIDASAWGGQIVTSLELVRRIFMLWASEQNQGSAADNVCEQHPHPHAHAQGRVSFSSALQVAASGNSGSSSQALGTLPERPSALPPRPQLLPDDAELLRQQGARSASSLLQQLVPRSMSETMAASSYRHSAMANASFRQRLALPEAGSVSSASGPAEHGQGTAAAAVAGRSRSYTDSGLSGPSLSHFLVAEPGQGAGLAAEAVSVLHLGLFSFKGCSDCPVVQVLSAATASRQFPAEPPRGKGQRLDACGADTPVSDLPEVKLVLPQSLVAARTAFALVGGGGSGGSGGSSGGTLGGT